MVKVRLGNLTLGTIATHPSRVHVMILPTLLRAQKFLRGPLLHPNGQRAQKQLITALECRELTLASPGHPPTLTS